MPGNRLAGGAAVRSLRAPDVSRHPVTPRGAQRTGRKRFHGSSSHGHLIHLMVISFWQTVENCHKGGREGVFGEVAVVNEMNEMNEMNIRL